jgi:predicted PurR-regulated permease PerM
MTEEKKQFQLVSYTPLILIMVFGVFILFELYSFIDAILGAIILYVLLRPLMTLLIVKKKWRPGWAAIALMFGSFVAVLVPIFGFSYLLISKLSLLSGDSSFLVQTIKSIDEKIYTLFNIRILSAENLVDFQKKATDFISGFLGETLSVLADVGVMYLLLYYMLINTGKLEEEINSHLPLSRENINMFSEELRKQTYSNAIGSPVMALAQGIFAWLGYLIFGLQDAFFWGMMTGFFSFIPIAGSTLIWLPAGLYQYSSGMHWQGIAIIIYGILVIGTIDNVFRFVFQKKFADVHPLITVFGVIIGLKVFGVPGLIFGPLLMSWFLILIRIYRRDH